jgi:hypothetical protein
MPTWNQVKTKVDDKMKQAQCAVHGTFSSAESVKWHKSGEHGVGDGEFSDDEDKKTDNKGKK